MSSLPRFTANDRVRLITVHIPSDQALNLIQAADLLVDEDTGQWVNPDTGDRYWQTDEALSVALEMLAEQL